MIRIKKGNSHTLDPTGGKERQSWTQEAALTPAPITRVQRKSLTTRKLLTLFELGVQGGGYVDTKNG